MASATLNEALEKAQDTAANAVADIKSRGGDLKTDLSDDIIGITGAWDEKAIAIDSVPVSLERTDVQVSQLVLAWVPVT